MRGAAHLNLGRRTGAIIALLALVLLACEQATAEDVTPISDWTTGTSGPSRNSAGSNRLLIFTAGMEEGADRTITSVTYGGRAMTPLVTGLAGTSTYARAYIFYLTEDEIALASSNNFSVTWSGSTDDAIYAARMYANVDQGSPIRGYDSATTNSSTPNPIETAGLAVVDGDYVVAAAQCGNARHYSWNNSFSEGTDQAGSTSDHSTADRPVTSNGLIVASATNSSPNRQVILAAVLMQIVEPTTYYVRPDGSNSNDGTGPSAGQAWRTIRNAIRDSPIQPGDTVYVMTGTYSESVYPNEDGTSSQPIEVIADTTGSVFGGSGGAVVIQAPNGSYALDFNGDDYIRFVGFTLRGNGSGVVSIDNSSGAEIHRCTITAGTYGVRVQGSGSELKLLNCLIHDNSNDGIRVVDGTVDIWNTTIVDNSNDGIEQDAGTVTIVNSIIALNASDGLDFDTGTMNHSYNLLYGNQDTDYDGTTAGTGELVQDPAFVDAGSGNYRLLPESPAIDVGYDASGTVDDDLDEHARPLGGGYDIGCYEYALLGQWTFDEGAGSSAADSSGNGADATLQSTAGWTATRCAYAAQFDGTSGWVDLGTFSLGTRAYAFAGWFKSSANTTQTLAAATASGTNEHVMLLTLEAAGHVQFVHRGPPASSGGTLLASSEPFNDGRWHHVAAVKSATQVQLYVDGALVDQTSDTTAVHSLVDVVLGRSGKGLSQNYLNGAMDDVGLYGGELSLQEVSALYGMILHWKLDAESGDDAVDSTGNGRDGSITGGANWLPAGGQVDGALDFDGTDDLVEYDAADEMLNGLSAVTVMCWVKPSTTNVDRGIFFTVAPSGNDDRFGMRYDKDGFAGGGQRLIKASISTTSGSRSIESASNVQTTAWQHIALVWASGENLRFFIDGQADTPADDPGPLGGTINNVDTLLLGLGTKNQEWDGRIDDFRIYNRALCADEISEIYASGTTNQGIRVIRWIEKK